MATVWAMLGNAFYLALVLNGWVRVDDYVDGHGLVAMVPMPSVASDLPLLSLPRPHKKDRAK
jgi:hypothetical protein